LSITATLEFHGDVLSITAVLYFDLALMSCPSPPVQHFFGRVVTIITAGCFRITNNLDRPAMILHFS
jgi:hypothetical protein